MFTQEQHNEIHQTWKLLSKEDRANANIFYVSPNELNPETYTQALLNCMILSGVWHSSENVTKAGAEEYEEIMAVQEIING